MYDADEVDDRLAALRDLIRGESDLRYAMASHTHVPIPPDPDLVPDDPVPVPMPEPPDDLEDHSPIVWTSRNNITVEGYRFVDTPGTAVRLVDCENILLRNCLFNRVGYKSIYAVLSRNVAVENCWFHDGGRNYVQFDKCVEGRVVDCSGSNKLGMSIAEDFVNLYKSHGTEVSPILIARNHFSNGGPSNSGSGTILGDNGGSWQVVEDNIYHDPGQIGIGISGGEHMWVRRNIVTSAQHPWSNVGIVSWAWNEASKPCSDTHVVDNTVDWVNAAGNQNPYWSNGSCGPVELTGNSWQ